jgi:E3 ubiquitin-protein ligase UBR7
MRLPESNPCTLRIDEKTGQKGKVSGEEPSNGNKYNQNFRNRFCGCEEQYDPHQEKGTMFQCLGLGTVEDGGCGEDWWHPECVVGLNREEYKKSVEKPKAEQSNGLPHKAANGILKEVSVTSADEPMNAHEDGRRPSVVTAITGGLDGNDVVANGEHEEAVDEDDPLPPGFPQEDDFEYFICYKCVNAFPWIKRYAGTPGFLPAVFYKADANGHSKEELTTDSTAPSDSKKRKASDEEGPAELTIPLGPPKRQKSEDPTSTLSSIPEDAASKDQVPITCKLTTLPAPPTSPFSLFLTPDFREHICHCSSCFPLLKPHPQLLEEEDTYEPPISEPDNEQSVGTGSLLDRGEAAFSNMDRVRAIEGAMVYAHLKDKVKAFLQPFAETGQPVGAEDIKAYFEKLRGDEKGIMAAAGGAKKEGGGGDGGGKRDGDGRKEQSGY